jgi:hypothetical protein
VPKPRAEGRESEGGRQRAELTIVREPSVAKALCDLAATVAIALPEWAITVTPVRVNKETTALSRWDEAPRVRVAARMRIYIRNGGLEKHRIVQAREPRRDRRGRQGARKLTKVDRKENDKPAMA